MDKQLSIVLTPEQVASLEAYIALPMWVEYVFDADLKQNIPRRKYASIENFLTSKFAGMMQGIMATPGCEPTSVATKTAQIAALQEEIRVANIPGSVTVTDMVA
jgi:hypothetical protein